jgi:ElaB/YqjD/DUF883 family membrane-anchored ribosome-binding protein
MTTSKKDAYFNNFFAEWETAGDEQKEFLRKKVKEYLNGLRAEWETASDEQKEFIKEQMNLFREEWKKIKGRVMEHIDTRNNKIKEIHCKGAEKIRELHLQFPGGEYRNDDEYSDNSWSPFYQ